MRFVKMLSLVAVVSIMVMVVAGAPSALAGSSLLCLKDTASQTPTPAECNAPTTLKLLTVSKADVTKDSKAIFLASPSIECEILITGTVFDTTLITNGPVRVEVAKTGLVFHSCNNSCAPSVKEGGTLLFLRTGIEQGTMVFDGFKFGLNCTFLFSCDFDGAGLVGTVVGPLTSGTNGKGHVRFEGKEVHLEQDLFLPVGSCPSSFKLDALFQFSTPVYPRA